MRERNATGGIIETLQAGDCKTAMEAAEGASNVNATPSGISTLSAGATARPESVRCFVEDLRGDPNYVTDPSVGPVLAEWATGTYRWDQNHDESSFNAAIVMLVEMGADPCLGPTDGPLKGMTPLEIAEGTSSPPSTVDVLRSVSNGC